MNNKDNVKSMEDYKKNREAYWAGWNAAVDAYTPPLFAEFRLKTPKASHPKPWYHWYTEQR